jgi:hypothetical protein
VSTAASRRAVLVTVALLLALAAALHLVRRGTIRAFFPDGAPGEAPALAQPTDVAPGLPAIERVRVVLIDGLGEASARALPTFGSLCEAGLDLRVDVGFPTVSLPVQHALWTGRTQQQSGVLYHIGRLPQPPDGALPSRIGSLAVVESHEEIAGSFGFGEVIAGEGFADAAARAVASPTPLVFVHVLRVDEAGHAAGGASEPYADAAVWADARLAEWIAADPHPIATRWFVLSDHGHLAGGGHGDAEDAIRIVRACVAGSLPVASPRTGAMHLVDLHRAIADSLGLVPAAGAIGRPLAFALEHPQPGATLPGVSTPRLVVAGVVVALGLFLGIAAARGRWLFLPWWAIVGYASLVLLRGPITLSNPVVFPPLGTDALVAAAPGLALLAFTAWRAREQPARLVRATLLPVIAVWLAAAIGCGAIEAVLGLTDRPPLVPAWSAHASVLASLSLAGCAVVALALAWRARSFAVVVPLVVACGGDEDGGDVGGGASSGADVSSSDGGGSTAETVSSSSGADASTSPDASTTDAPPPCDPALPPVGDMCMRACGLYDTCGETFSNCTDTQCCIDACESLRLLFWQATPVCGAIADAMYECVADLDCRQLAMITDTELLPTDPCAMEIGARGSCTCGAG